MQIKVFIGIDFANEDSPLYVAKKITKRNVYSKRRDGSEEFVPSNIIEQDKSSQTTLAELYADGWRLVSQDKIQLGWYYFFMERA